MIKIIPAATVNITMVKNTVLIVRNFVILMKKSLLNFVTFLIIDGNLNIINPPAIIAMNMINIFNISNVSAKDDT
jgi:hypothetical protein